MRSRTIYNDDGTVAAEYVNGELVRGHELEKLTKTHPGVHVFKSGMFEHISPDGPIYCGSKADLRAVCRENNCTSDYAE